MPWFINDIYELSDIAILNIKSADYCCIIKRLSKPETINLMQNIKHKNLLSQIKIVKEILKFGDTEIEKNKFYDHESYPHFSNKM